MVEPGPLHELSLSEAGRLLRAGGVTSTQLTEHQLARIDRIDPAISAFIVVTRERALADARAADDAFAHGRDAGPFQGVPYALKDLYDVAGVATTCHSKLRMTYVPTEDSAVAAKLRGQGGVLLGKLATHEFALGGPSFDLPFPPARNPWNPEHVTGGSSSGSAAAVAAGFVRMALGAFVTAADLTQAMRLRRELAVAVNAALKTYDVLVTASTVAPAPRFDAGPSPVSSGPTQNMPFNVSGNPAMAIPTGFSGEGLPLSMQIVGRAFDEATVLGVGAAYEAEQSWRDKRPALAA
jgi:Asp-tRNA(Asn)/Glu-tRNA(Gln) amidotransferase A subunit family amidase